MKWLEEAREIDIKAEYDVIVCGGGPAGVSAAVSAARQGARTFAFRGRRVSRWYLDSRNGRVGTRCRG